MTNLREFNWFGDCTSCNTDCCHNTNKFISEYECIKPEAKDFYNPVRSNISDNNSNIIPENASDPQLSQNTSKPQDNRPLECRLFPFDVKDIDGKIYWVKWNTCHATPKLDYEKFMNFFERKFSREMSFDNIKRYAEHQKISDTKGHPEKEYSIIREINWPK
ncbi:MAG: hypothetical protein ACP5NW_04710 [Candidatus Woesearchaeota archaeon]